MKKYIPFFVLFFSMEVSAQSMNVRISDTVRVLKREIQTDTLQRRDAHTGGAGIQMRRGIRQRSAGLSGVNESISVPQGLHVKRDSVNVKRKRERGF